MPELVGMNRLPVNENVAMIGHSYGCCHELEFLSDANLYEYSTLILDPREISSELLKTGGPPFRGVRLCMVHRAFEASEYVGTLPDWINS